jgi:hypothetical protein
MKDYCLVRPGNPLAGGGYPPTPGSWAYAASRQPPVKTHALEGIHAIDAGRVIGVRIGARNGTRPEVIDLST